MAVGDFIGFQYWCATAHRSTLALPEISRQPACTSNADLRGVR
jgi:hypothetical protein